MEFSQVNFEECETRTEALFARPCPILPRKLLYVDSLITPTWLLRHSGSMVQVNNVRQIREAGPMEMERLR
jgi:hypothetical protein